MLSAHNSFLIAVNVGGLAGVLVLTTPQASLFSSAGPIGLTGTPGGWAPKSVVLQADNGRGGEEPEGIPRPDPPAPVVLTAETQPADRLSPTLLLRIVWLGLVGSAGPPRKKCRDEPLEMEIAPKSAYPSPSTSPSPATSRADETRGRAACVIASPVAPPR